jgi:hypothetical protein
MKTAIELADEFPEQNLANIEPDAANLLNGWGLEAVAMLLQQADQIEALTIERDKLNRLLDKAVESNDRYISLQESLKADAARYLFAREKFMCYREENNDDATRRHGSELVIYAAELHIDLPRVYSTYGGIHEYKVDPKAVDAAIDAMKGKS